MDIAQIVADPDRAAQVAEELVARGQVPQALEILSGVMTADPGRDSVRARFAELYFKVHEGRLAMGTAERGRLLLELMALDHLSQTLADAYLENLKHLLRDRLRRPAPGRLVLGLGSGRCGSTSLAAMIGQAPEVCATHENPPPIHWTPTPARIAFHAKRFAILRDHFALVFDAAHWWLNALDGLSAEAGELEVVGLVRDAEACVRSFLRIKGRGRGSLNHWAGHDGGYWKKALWDRMYPSFATGDLGLGPAGPGDAVAMDRIKTAQVTRYVEDYNQALAQAAQRLGERALLVRTEDLTTLRTQRAIFDFLGLSGDAIAEVLNRGTTADGTGKTFRL